MNHQYGCAVNAAGRKQNRWSAALALVVGLVLTFSGTAAWAIGGIDILAWGWGIAAPGPDGEDVKLGKNPRPIPVTARTGPDGTYKFTGLAPGKYDLSIGGQPVQTISVGTNGSITGVLSRNDDGTTSISFNGQSSGSVLLPTASVSQSGGTLATERRGTVPRPGGEDGKASITLSGKDGSLLPTSTSNRDHIDQDAQTDVIKRTVTKPTSPGPTHPIGNLGTLTAPSPKGGGQHSDQGAASGTLRVINNSETDTAKIAGTSRMDSTPVNGIGGFGGGRYTFKPTSGKRVETGTGTGGGDERDAKLGTLQHPRPSDETGKLPGLATPGTPIIGIPIGLEGDPGSIKVSANTDENGAFHFTDLPAGNYKLTLPDGQTAKSISISPDGKFDGTVKRGSGGSMDIFDRWGSRILSGFAPLRPAEFDVRKQQDATNPVADKPLAKKPDTGSFGSGNTPGGFPGSGAGPMSPNAGPMSPGAGPMSPGAGPMSPGAGPMGPGAGGPGGAAGPRP